MSLDTFLVHDITILTATPTTDRYNNTVLDWTSATGTAAKAWIAPTVALEIRDQRDATVTTVEAFFAVGTPVTAYDRIVYAGATYEVVGKVHPEPTPRGIHHLQATLREVVG